MHVAARGGDGAPQAGFPSCAPGAPPRVTEASVALPEWVHEGDVLSFESSDPDHFRALPITSMAIRAPLSGSLRHVVPLGEINADPRGSGRHVHRDPATGRSMLRFCVGHFPSVVAAHHEAQIRINHMDSGISIASIPCRAAVIVPGVAVSVVQPPTLPRYGAVDFTITLSNDSDTALTRRLELRGLPPAVTCDMAGPSMQQAAGQNVVLVPAAGSLSVRCHLSSNGGPAGKHQLTLLCQEQAEGTPGDDAEVSSSPSPTGSKGVIELLIEAEMTKLVSVVDGVTGDAVPFDDVANGLREVRRVVLKNLSKAPITIEAQPTSIQGGSVVTSITSNAKGDQATATSTAEDASKRRGSAAGVSPSDSDDDDATADDAEYKSCMVPAGGTATAFVAYTPALQTDTAMAPVSFSVAFVAATVADSGSNAQPVADGGGLRFVAQQHKLKLKCSALVHSGRLTVSRREVSFGTAPLGDRTTAELTVINSSHIPATVSIVCRSKIIGIAGLETPNVDGKLMTKLDLPPSSSHKLVLVIVPRRVNARYRKQLTITNDSNPIDHVVVDLDSNNVPPVASAALDNVFVCEEVQLAAPPPLPLPGARAGSEEATTRQTSSASGRRRGSVLAAPRRGMSTMSVDSLDTAATDGQHDADERSPSVEPSRPATTGAPSPSAERSAADSPAVQAFSGVAPSPETVSNDLLPPQRVAFDVVSEPFTWHVVAGFPHVRLFRLLNTAPGDICLTFETTKAEEITVRRVPTRGAAGANSATLLERQIDVVRHLFSGEPGAAKAYFDGEDDVRRGVTELAKVNRTRLCPGETAIVAVVLHRTLDSPITQFTTKEDTLTIKALEVDLPPRYVRLTYKLCSAILDVSDQQLHKNFGRVNIGEKRPMKVRLTNPSQVPLLLRLSKSRRVSASDVRVDEMGANDVAFLTVPQLRSHDLHILVAPTIRGPFHESLNVTNLLSPASTMQVTVKADVDKLDSFDVIPEAIQIDCELTLPDDLATPATNDGSMSGVGTSKLVLVNKSRHRRVLVLSVAGDGLPRFADAVTRYTVDVEVTKASGSSRAKLEDEIEKLEQKLKIARRKNKLDKVARTERRLAKLRAQLGGSTGDSSDSSVNDDVLDYDSASDFSESESDDDEVQRSLNAKRTSSVDASNSAAVLKKGLELPAMMPGDQATVSLHMTCTAGSLITQRAAAVGTILPEGAPTVLSVSEVNDKDMLKTVPLDVRITVPAPEDHPPPPSGNVPEPATTSTNERSHSEVKTQPDESSPGAAQSPSHAGSRSPLPDDSALAANGDVGHGHEATASEPAPDTAAEQKQTGNGCLWVASARVVSSTSAAPSSVDTAELASGWTPSPSLLDVKHVWLGELPVHTSASLEFTVAATSGDVRFVVLGMQRIGGVLQGSHDAKLKLHTPSAIARAGAPVTVVAEVTPRMLGRQSYLLPVQNPATPSDTAFVAIAFDALPSTLDHLSIPAAGLDFGTLSLSMVDDAVSDRRMLVRNPMSGTLTLAISTTTPFLQVFTVAGGAVDDEVPSTTVSIGAHGSQQLAVRWSQPPLRNRAPFEGSHELRSGVTLSMVVLSANQQPVVVSTFHVPVVCRVTCPMLRIVGDEAATNNKAESIRVPVGVTSTVAWVSVQNMSDVVPVEFTVIDSAHTDTVGSICVVDSADPVPPGQTAHLLARVRPVDTGTCTVPLELVNETVRQPAVRGSVTFFAQDDSVSAAPMNVPVPLVPLAHSVDADGQVSLTLAPQAESLGTFDLQNNTRVAVSVTLQADVPVTFEEATGHQGECKHFVVTPQGPLRITIRPTNVLPSAFVQQHLAALLSGNVVTVSAAIYASVVHGSGKPLSIGSVEIAFVLPTVSGPSSPLDVGRFGKIGEEKSIEIAFSSMTAISARLAWTELPKEVVASETFVVAGAETDQVRQHTETVQIVVSDRVDGLFTLRLVWRNLDNASNAGVVTLNGLMEGSIWKFFSRRAQMQAVGVAGDHEPFELPSLHFDPEGSTRVLAKAQLGISSGSREVSVANTLVVPNPALQDLVQLQLLSYDTSAAVSDNSSIEIDPRKAARDFYVQCIHEPSASLRNVAKVVMDDAEPSSADGGRLWIGDIVFRGQTSRDERIRVLVPREPMPTFELAPRNAVLKPSSRGRATTQQQSFTASLTLTNLCAETTTVSMKSEMMSASDVSQKSTSAQQNVAVVVEPSTVVLDSLQTNVAVTVTLTLPSGGKLPSGLRLVASDTELDSAVATVRLSHPTREGAAAKAESAVDPSNTAANGGPALNRASENRGSVAAPTRDSSVVDLAEHAGDSVGLASGSLSSAVPTVVLAGLTAAVNDSDSPRMEIPVDLHSASSSAKSSSAADGSENDGCAVVTVPCRLRNLSETSTAYFELTLLGDFRKWLVSVDSGSHGAIQDPSMRIPAAVSVGPVACDPLATVTITLRVRRDEMARAAIDRGALLSKLLVSHFEVAGRPERDEAQAPSPAGQLPELVPHSSVTPILADLVLRAVSLPDVLDFLPASASLGSLHASGFTRSALRIAIPQHVSRLFAKLELRSASADNGVSVVACYDADDSRLRTSSGAAILDDKCVVIDTDSESGNGSLALWLEASSDASLGRSDVDRAPGDGTSPPLSGASSQQRSLWRAQVTLVGIPHPHVEALLGSAPARRSIKLSALRVPSALSLSLDTETRQLRLRVATARHAASPSVVATTQRPAVASNDSLALGDSELATVTPAGDFEGAAMAEDAAMRATTGGGARAVVVDCNGRCIASTDVFESSKSTIDVSRARDSPLLYVIFTAAPAVLHTLRLPWCSSTEHRVVCTPLMQRIACWLPVPIDDTDMHWASFVALGAEASPSAVSTALWATRSRLLLPHHHRTGHSAPSWWRSALYSVSASVLPAQMAGGSSHRKEDTATRSSTAAHK